MMYATTSNRNASGFETSPTTISSVFPNTTTSLNDDTLMETEPWWPGLLVAVVSSLILLLFLVTLLVHHLPPVQKWLLPVLIRIAPSSSSETGLVNKNEPHSTNYPASSGPAQTIQSSTPSADGVGHQFDYDPTCLGSPQPHQPLYPRSRPSRPSSLPCLPEEKLAYYPAASSVVAVAAAAAAQAAQAAAMPHRPHTFYPPPPDDDDEEEELEGEDELDDDDCTTPQQQPPYPPQQRGRVHHKLNLALHSDGSEASNSSSSASAINDHADHPHHHSHQHQGDQQQQQQQFQPRRHHRSSSEAVLRQRAANRHQDLAHHQQQQQQQQQQTPQHHQQHRLLDHDGEMQRLDEWTLHRPPPTQRQSSLAETDCDVSSPATSSSTSTTSCWSSVTAVARLHGRHQQHQQLAVPKDSNRRVSGGVRPCLRIPEGSAEGAGRSQSSQEPGANSPSAQGAISRNRRDGVVSRNSSSCTIVDTIDPLASNRPTDHVVVDIQQTSSSSSSDEDDDRIDASSSMPSSVGSSNKFKASKGLSRSLAVLTATGLGRIRSMIHLADTNIHRSHRQAESMMDMTDMSSTFGESESVSGSVILAGHSNGSNKAVIEMGLCYNSSTGKLVVRLVELRQLTSASRNTSVQLRLLLLPDRKQRCKSKLRYVNEYGGSVVIGGLSSSTNINQQQQQQQQQQSTSNNTNVPMMETFVFNRIEPAELSSTGIRLRLYGSERLRRERLLGEAFVGLASLALDHQREQSLLVALETKSGPLKKSLAALGRSTSSSSSRGDVSPTSIGPSDQWPPEMIPPRNGIPELLLGLAYNGTTGRLSVEILRASSLRSWTSNRTPDACVKILLLTQTGQELGRAKTLPKKSSDGPTWLETFAFQVTLFQLAEVTLLISVVNKRSLKRRELIGWISLGFDSSVEQQTEHWQEMREAAGEQICHWHALLPP